MTKYLFVTMVLFVQCTARNHKDDTQSKEPVVKSLLGVEYFEPERSEAVQAKLDSNLLVAKANLAADSSEENFIWYGRREGYLSHFKEAIAIFSKGIERYPDAYKLFRHRGHRYISIRDFGKAVADLQQAAAMMPAQPLEIEPDGQPNKINTPLSNTQFNVWYHLGLAHYLRGDFPNAERAYEQCLQVSNNDDLLCATTDWLYMTYRRLGKHDEAGRLLALVSDTMKIIENDSYYKRLRLYKGQLTAEEVLHVEDGDEDADLALATQGYGVANWYLCNGDTARAKSILNRVVEGKYFSAFGFIAAEAELVRLRGQ